MTREEFLSQAESMKKGLTEEQMVRAILADVNTCKYLAAQGQMYHNGPAGAKLDKMIHDIHKLISNCSKKEEKVLNAFNSSMSISMFEFDTPCLDDIVALKPYEFVYVCSASNAFNTFLRAADISIEEFAYVYAFDFNPSTNVQGDLYFCNTVKNRIKQLPKAFMDNRHLFTRDGAEAAETIISGAMDEMLSKYGRAIKGGNKITREEFLSQAESMKAGLTEEQMVQAVLADVNTCQYLAAQGQMYSIEDIIGREDCDSIKIFIEQHFGEHMLENAKKCNENVRYFMFPEFYDIVFVGGIARELYPYEFAYLFFSNNAVKTILDAAKMTKEEFEKQYLAEYIKDGKKINKDIVSKAKVRDYEVKIDDGKEDIETMIAGMMDEMASEYGKLANGEVQMTKEHAEELKKMLGEFNIDKLKQMKAMSKEERDKAIIDVLYSIVEPGLNDLSDEEKETAKEVSMEVMAKNDMLGKMFDLFIQALEAYPDETVLEENIKEVIKFSTERNIPLERKQSILRILSSLEVQEKLKKFKIRTVKNEPIYHELIKYPFEEEKYDFAFIAKSMIKGKSICILLNSNIDKKTTDIFLLDSQYEQD